MTYHSSHAPFVRFITLTTLVALSLTLICTTASTATARPLSQSDMTVTLTPAAGPPGTHVVLRGYIPAAKSRHNQSFGIITFGGWPNGLPINPAQVTWSKTAPGHFVTEWTVPKVPWLSPTGEAPLHVGRYAVGLQCFGTPVQGCGIRTPEYTTSFMLTGPVPVVRRSPTLVLKPANAVPGEFVNVSGWAPLTQVFGASPFGYQLILQQGDQSSSWGGIGGVSQTPAGNLYGSFQMPAWVNPMGQLHPGPVHLALQYSFTNQGAVGKAHGTLILDAKKFDIIASPTWQSVFHKGTLRTLTSNQNSGYFGALATSGKQIYATTASGIWISDNGARTWRRVPTATMTHIVRVLGYKLFSQANMMGLTISPGYPTHLFASVPTEQPKFGAPPIINLGLYTVDGGRLWRAVPHPTGMTVGDFGGFELQGHAVWAWWQSNNSRTPRIAAQVTYDGGATWHLVTTSSLDSTHPGILLGPVPSQSFGQMSNAMEPVVTAGRAGWIVVNSVVNNGVISQLANLSDGVTLLLGNSQFPIQMTSNGGRTWQDVQTPAIPGGGASSSSPPAMHLLPSGTLLAQDPMTGAWWALHPEHNGWRKVPLQDVLKNSNGPYVIGNDVYWVSQTAQSQTSPPEVRMVPVSRY